MSVVALIARAWENFPGKSKAISENKKKNTNICIAWKWNPRKGGLKERKKKHEYNLKGD